MSVASQQKTLIDEKMIEGLNPDQVALAHDLLKKIFLGENQIDSLTESDARILSLLIESSQAPHMKIAMLDALIDPVKVQVAKKLSNKEQVSLFNYLPHLPFVKSLFKQLPKDGQLRILKSLYSTNKERYAELKSILHEPVTMVAGVLIKKSNVLAQFKDREKNIILDLMQNPNKTTEDLKNYAKALQKKFEFEDLENLVLVLSESFGKLNIGIQNQTQFGMYLKFFSFLEPFLALFKQIPPQLLTPIEKLTMALPSLPNAEWRIKVLTQLPDFAITLVFKRLRQHKQIKDNSKRLSYQKCLQDILGHLNSPKAVRLNKLYQKL